MLMNLTPPFYMFLSHLLTPACEQGMEIDGFVCFFFFQLSRGREQRTKEGKRQRNPLIDCVVVVKKSMYGSDYMSPWITVDPTETTKGRNKIFSLDSHITSHRITSHQSPPVIRSH